MYMCVCNMYVVHDRVCALPGYDCYSFETRMMHRFVIPGYDMAAAGRKSLDREYSTLGSVSSRKHNRCVIFPASVNMVAEALERRQKALFVRTKVASDLIVQVEEYSFHLHKLPMVCRSGSLNRLVFQRRSIQEKDTSLNIRIENLPGGTEIFELVVKFCYGWKIALTATNIAPLYCAAHFLEMSDDLEPGNLLSKADAFLNFVIFSSWKETFQIFKSCESISAWANEFQVLKRCSEAVAWKACIDPETIRRSNEDAQCRNFLENSTKKSQLEKVAESWWFEDVSFLRIDHFVLVIDSIKGKGMRPELIGSCITHWTTRWLPRIAFGLDNLANKNLTHQVHRFTVESLITVIPSEENSISCNFLLHLLKLGLTMKIDSELLSNLERRLAFMLEQCRVADLLVKSYGDNTTSYDVGIVVKVVESYVSCVSSNPTSRILVVGRLVDDYLTYVARDENLTPKCFHSLVKALPKSARYCDDNLYRAIDMYLKAHPSLTEEERSGICRVLEYFKLSQEARKHAVKNDRLPENTIARFILLEQVSMTRSVTAVGTNYQRTLTQAIIRVRRGLEKQCLAKSQKEMKTMKEEVESIKMQLRKLQTCKVKLKKQAKRCIFFG